MFGTNEIVGKKYFAGAPKDTLLVTSVFYTLQGEGPFSGRPAIFVRLAKCNLNCSFCDTFFDSGEVLTFDQLNVKIDEAIRSYFHSQGLVTPQWASSTHREHTYHRGVVLIITGGEPALQSNLIAYLNSVSVCYADIQIETNGTIPLEFDERSLPITVVCSPKCHEKTQRYLTPSDAMLARAHYLKFVVSADPESPYHTIPQWADNWLHEHDGKAYVQRDREIYVSPMNIYNTLPQKIKEMHNLAGGMTLEQRSNVDEVISFWEPGVLNMEQNQRNHEYAARYAISNGFRFQVQVHLYAGLA